MMILVRVLMMMVMFNWQWANNNDEEPNVDTQNGFITNVNGGLQYTNKWNDKYNFNLSPKYNSQHYQITNKL